MKYRKELPARLLSFFDFSAGEGLPTFSDFRRQEGLCLRDFSRFLKRADFAAAVAEANARLADALRVGALTKRYDPSFVKFLLTEADGGQDGEAAERRFSVEIRVVE